MFAVIKVKGHQYRVEPDEMIVVDRMSGKPGDKLTFPSLLYVDGEDVKLGKAAGAITVTARIEKHMQGAKIHVRRFREKSRHRRHIGFRHQLSELKIEEIGDKKAQVAKSTRKESQSKKATRKKVKSKKTISKTKQKQRRSQSKSNY